jgi:DNA mismatch repair ATPase MutS
MCLALRVERPLVGNDIEGQGRRLVIITGANGGGKSTFLRSIGVAQMMLSSGMFVAADSLRAGVAPAVFTHFRREEDTGLERGKLGEELSRMDEIADRIGPGCLLLCNESFASTNEREGSEIAHQMIRAFTESRVAVCFVTHVYELARRCHAQGRPDALFLRAERREDGTRTFRLLPAEPLPTSFGQDLYSDIFGVPGGTTSPSEIEASD